MKLLHYLFIALLVISFSGCDITKQEDNKLSIDDDITYEELLSLPIDEISTAVIDYSYLDNGKGRHFDIHL